MGATGSAIPEKIKKSGIKPGQRYYVHKDTGDTRWGKPDGALVKVVSWEEVQLRRQRRAEKLSKAPYSCVPFDYGILSKQELENNEGRLKACLMKLKANPGSEHLLREKRKLRRAVEDNKKGVEEAEAAKREADKRGGKKVESLDAEMAMDMTEAWVHERGEEE